MLTLVTHLECSLTGEHYVAGEINNLSRAGKPLLVRYDLAAAARTLTREDIASRSPGMWKWRELLPHSGEPVSLGMSFVNVIWQGDANALALAALAHAAAPEPFIVNVAGPDILRVADLARRLGSRLGIAPVFSGDESASALLSNASRMGTLTGDPLLPLDTLLDWTAAWVRAGGRLLGKPTGFEQRDGRF